MGRMWWLCVQFSLRDDRWDSKTKDIKCYLGLFGYSDQSLKVGCSDEDYSSIAPIPVSR